MPIMGSTPWHPWTTYLNPQYWLSHQYTQSQYQSWLLDRNICLAIRRPRPVQRHIAEVLHLPTFQVVVQPSDSRRVPRPATWLSDSSLQLSTFQHTIAVRLYYSLGNSAPEIDEANISRPSQACARLRHIATVTSKIAKTCVNRRSPLGAQYELFRY
jgi:hypothetical protein